MPETVNVYLSDALAKDAHELAARWGGLTVQAVLRRALRAAVEAEGVKP